MASANLIRSAIADAGLLAPDLDRSARRRAVDAIADRYGISQSTVYRHISLMAQGAPARRARSDRGQSRALSAPVLATLHRMCVEPRYAGCNVAQLTELLKAAHPGENIRYATVRAEYQRFLASLPRAVSTPRRIEVASANQRWEMDLSRGDLFVADPTRNDGFPFRPQLIVAIDARTRCILYAQYTSTGCAVDVGSTLFNAMIPQSDIWPQAGIPTEVGCDWGKVFVGEYFPTVCKNLGINVNAGHPYYPQDKGKVERAIGTIHNNFENTLVGYTTNDNTGDNAIDPRKFFRPVGAQWIDPRFDQALLTLHQANTLLWDYIAGTYHTRKHSTLGCSPNQAWIAEMRGRQITLPPRERLEQEFLPWQWRVVRRGQIRMFHLDFYHPVLSNYEGLNVQVRYTPDDIRRVWVYYDRARVCEATPADVFIMGSDQNDWKSFNAIRRANQQSAQLRAQVIQELRDAEIQIAESASVYRDRAEDATPLLVPAPVERDVDPELSHLSDEQIAELDEITIYGVEMPGAAGRRVASAG